MIDFNEWKKLDLRVAQIKEAKDHPNAEKLLILKVDIGGEEKQLVAGLKQHYKKEELIGKKVIVFTNLKPVTLRGVESQGMILAAVDQQNISLITTDKVMKCGSKIE